MKAYLFLACAFLTIVTLTGCDTGPKLPQTVPAEGIVTLDGTPMSDVTIIFIAEKGTYNATAVSDKSGKFAMKAFEQKSGAVAGSYKVELNKTVVDSKGMKGGEAEVNMTYGLPMKYASFTTSGITITLPESGNKDIKFDLVSK